MAIRITLECGHTSELRAQRTAEGYTHDWQVFVRGVDNAEIHQYIEKGNTFINHLFIYFYNLFISFSFIHSIKNFIYLFTETIVE